MEKATKLVVNFTNAEKKLKLIKTKAAYEYHMRALGLDPKIIKKVTEIEDQCLNMISSLIDEKKIAENIDNKPEVKRIDKKLKKVKEDWILATRWFQDQNALKDTVVDENPQDKV